MRISGFKHYYETTARLKAEGYVRCKYVGDPSSIAGEWANEVGVFWFKPDLNSPSYGLAAKPGGAGGLSSTILYTKEVQPVSDEEAAESDEKMLLAERSHHQKAARSLIKATAKKIAESMDNHYLSVDQLIGYFGDQLEEAIVQAQLEELDKS